MGQGLASNYARTVMTKVPWLYWRFGQTLVPPHASQVTDLSGNARHGVWWNASTQPSPTQLCFYPVAAPGEYLANPPQLSCWIHGANVGDIPYGGPWGGQQALHPGTQRTIEWWHWREAVGGKLGMVWSQFPGAVFDQRGTYLYCGGQFGFSARTVGFAPKGNTGAVTTWVDVLPAGPFGDGTQVATHCALLVDDVNHLGTLYVNGVSQGQQVIGALLPYHVGNYLRMADWAFDNQYNVYIWRGYIDELAIYDRLLTPDEIKSNYLVGSGLEPRTHGLMAG